MFILYKDKKCLGCCDMVVCKVGIEIDNLKDFNSCVYCRYVDSCDVEIVIDGVVCDGYL